ncbi:hypothetical protein BAE44_0012986 [Dichanthelium oligosanthes]|uniref:Uncharacterized protein n=1 Tax=Dichanthelium oligosanthes TaxID=888268 RepID=A0A1E5VLJ6_9POAL|nr:hypothetical protein BAE44_0012986 [Dichanthelium oligosanthes]
MYMACGHPVAAIETFLQSATPVIGQIPRTTSVALRIVWKWYEEPESFGIEVEIQRGVISSNTSGCAYFVPSLSAVQLFGQSSFSTSADHGGLLFEYFEWEKPFFRPPLFTKIKQLVSGVNLSGNPMFGDPKQLESVKLSDLHPASCANKIATLSGSVLPGILSQIPSVAGSCQAAFLTYHSLGKLVPQTCPTDMADGLTSIICRIVSLLSYKDEFITVKIFFYRERSSFSNWEHNQGPSSLLQKVSWKPIPLSF